MLYVKQYIDLGGIELLWSIGGAGRGGLVQAWLYQRMVRVKGSGSCDFDGFEAGGYWLSWRRGGRDVCASGWMGAGG